MTEENKKQQQSGSKQPKRPFLNESADESRRYFGFTTANDSKPKEGTGNTIKNKGNNNNKG